MATNRAPSLLLSSLSIFVLVVVFLLFSFRDNPRFGIYQTEHNSRFKAPKENIWAELTEKEAYDVYEFVYKELSHLNLTRRPRSNRDNFIFIAETLQPNKDRCCVISLQLCCTTGEMEQSFYSAEFR